MGGLVKMNIVYGLLYAIVLKLFGCSFLFTIHRNFGSYPSVSPTWLGTPLCRNLSFSHVSHPMQASPRQSYCYSSLLGKERELYARLNATATALF